jgi:hypothetical protein
MALLDEIRRAKKKRAIKDEADLLPDTPLISVEIAGDIAPAPAVAPAATAEPEPPAVKFTEAFATARAAGEKTFAWMGGEYTTETEEEAAAAQPKAAAVVETPRPAALTADTVSDVFGNPTTVDTYEVPRLSDQLLGRDPARAAYRPAATKVVEEVLAGKRKPQGRIDPSAMDFETVDEYKDAGTIKRGVARGVNAVKQQAAGLHEFIGDTVGADGYAGAMTDTGRKLDSEAEAIGTRSQFLTRNWEGAVSSIISQTPGLAIAALSGGSAPLLLMGVQVFGDEYSTGKAAGLTYADSVTRAGVNGVAEIIGEKIGMASFTKTFKAMTEGVPTDQWLTLLGSHVLREIPGEQLTTAIQFSNDKFTDYGLDKEATLNDYLSQAADTLVQTVMQAGAMGAPGAGVNFVQGRRAQTATVAADAAKTDALAAWDKAFHPTPRAESPASIVPHVGNTTEAGTSRADDAVLDAAMSDAIAQQGAAVAEQDAVQQQAVAEQEALETEAMVAQDGRIEPTMDPEMQQAPIEEPGRVEPTLQPEAVQEAAPFTEPEQAPELNTQAVDPALEAATVQAAPEGVVSEVQPQAADTQGETHVPSHPDQQPLDMLARQFADAAAELDPADQSDGAEHIRGNAAGLAGIAVVAPESLRDDGVAGGIGSNDVEFLTKLGDLSGIKFVYVNAPNIGAEQFTVPEIGKTIYVDVSTPISAAAAAVTAGHETTHIALHTLRNSTDPVDRDIAGTVDQMMEDNLTGEDYLKYRRYYGDPKMDPAKLREEAASDIGGNLHADPVFWERVLDAIDAKHGASGVRKFIASMKQALTKLTELVQGRSFQEGYVTNAAQVREAVAQALVRYYSHHGAGADMAKTKANLALGVKASPKRAPKKAKAPKPAAKDVARVVFEVAPDPNDAAMAAAWNRLDAAGRQRISAEVAQAVLPGALRALGIDGALQTQTGSYLDDTNPSFALALDDPAQAGPAARFLGHVLSQDSMMVISEAAFPEGERVGAVTLALPAGAGVAEIYRQLREIRVDGAQPIAGQSTSGGMMAILNYSDVPTTELARLVDEKLGGTYDVHVDDVFAYFPEKKDYGYASDRQEGATPARRTPLQRNADRLRAEATRLVRDAVGQTPRSREVKRSPQRLFDEATRANLRATPYARRDGAAGPDGLLKASYTLDPALQRKLNAAGISTPRIDEITDAGSFRSVIQAAKAGSPYGAAVFIYPLADYQGMRLFLAEGGRAGFALKGDDIVSVFNNDPALKRAAHATLPLAVQLGGRRLDAFDTVLPVFYAEHGFKATSRLRWDEGQAPDGWDEQTFGEFNHGEPDVVYMAYDPAYAATYSPDDGKRVEDYDEAVALQQAAVDVKKSTQRDMFEGDFADRRSKVTDTYVASTKGATEEVKRGNLNSENKQIAHTKQALRSFWDWFGDSAAAFGGQPTVMYHSTSGDFTAFETMRETTNSGTFGTYASRRAGIFMTPNRDFAQTYREGDSGQNVMQLYIRAENPADLRNGLSNSVSDALEAQGYNTRMFNQVQHDWELFEEEFGGPDLVAALKAAGYDGAIINETDEEGNGQETWVAFDPEQVKSATGNQGSFNAANLNMVAEPQKLGYDNLYDNLETRPDTRPEQLELGRSALRAAEERIFGRLPTGLLAGTSLLGSGISRDFRADGGTSLVGKPVRDAKDLATLAQVLRDPRFETVRVFYTAGGQIVGERAYSSRLPAAAYLDPNAVEHIKRDMDSFVADGYWLLHNHPSGSAVESQADLRLTEAVAEQVPGFAGHVIIDTNTFNSITLKPNGVAEGRVIGAPELEGINLRANQEAPHPILGEAISSPDALAGIAKRLQKKDGYITLIGTDSQQRVTLITEVPATALQIAKASREAELRLLARVKRATRETGARNLFAVVPGNLNDYRVLLNARLFTDVVEQDTGRSGHHLGMYSGGIPETKVEQRGGKGLVAKEDGPKPVDTPEFSKWFGDSKVVDADGKPLRVYHGTSGSFGEFNTKGGTGKSFNTGAFFTASPKTADTYTGGVGGSVVPVYLSLRNPVVIDAQGKNWNAITQSARVELPAVEVSDQADENLLAELEDRPPQQGVTKKVKAKKTKVRELFTGEWDYPDDTASTDDLARWARVQGYDGLIVNNVVDQGPTGTFASDESKAPGTLYVAFDPTQIKSAIGNDGSFDATNPDILKSPPRADKTRDQLAEDHARMIGQDNEAVVSHIEQVLKSIADDGTAHTRGPVPHATTDAAAEHWAKQMGWSVEVATEVLNKGATLDGELIPASQLLGAASTVTRLSLAELMDNPGGPDFAQRMASTINLLITTRANLSEIGRALNYAGKLQGATGRAAQDTAVDVINRARHDAEEAIGESSDKSPAEQALVAKYNEELGKLADVKMAIEQATEDTSQAQMDLDGVRVQVQDARAERDAAKKLLSEANAALRDAEKKRDAAVDRTPAPFTITQVEGEARRAVKEAEAARDWEKLVKERLKAAQDRLTRAQDQLQKAKDNAVDPAELKRMEQKARMAEAEARLATDALKEAQRKMRESANRLKAAQQKEADAKAKMPSAYDISQAQGAARRAEQALDRATAELRAAQKELSKLRTKLTAAIRRKAEQEARLLGVQARVAALRQPNFIGKGGVSMAEIEASVGGTRGMKRIADAMRAHPDMDIGQVAQFFQGVANNLYAMKLDAKSRKGLWKLRHDFVGAVLEQFRAFNLTGVFTHMVNLMSNVAFTTLDMTVTRALAEGLQSGPKGVARHYSAATKAMLRSVADVIAVARFGITQEFPAAHFEALAKARAGTRQDLLDLGNNKWMDHAGGSLPGLYGKGVRSVGFSPLGMADLLFKIVPYRYAIALQEAKNPGKPVDYAAALSLAEYGVFQSKLGEITSMLPRLVNVLPELGFLVPYIKTLVNLVKTAATLDPLLSTLMHSNDMAGTNGKDEQRLGFARVMVSFALAAIVLALYGDGEDDEDNKLTGPGPLDFNKKKLWMANNDPLALKIGDTSTSLERIEPLAGAASLIIADKKAVGLLLDGEVMRAAGVLATAWSQLVIGKSFMAAPADFLEAMTDAGEAEDSEDGSTRATKFFKRQSMSIASAVLIPNFFTQIGDVTDPHRRDTSSGKWEDVLARRLPWTRQNLDPQLGYDGEELPNPRHNTFSPVIPVPRRHDPTAAWLLGRNVPLTAAPKGLKHDKDGERLPLELREMILQKRHMDLTKAMYRSGGYEPTKPPANETEEEKAGRLQEKKMLEDRARKAANPAKANATKLTKKFSKAYGLGDE